jgi:hypothetical protein
MLLMASEASAKFARRAPGTVTFTSEVALRLGRSEMASSASVCFSPL